VQDARAMTDGLEYTGLMALAWDPLRGNTSGWEDRALFLDLIAELGQPVLDVGCGTGRLLLDYLALGIDIDGLEISPDMLEILRAKAASSGLDVTGRIHQGAMESHVLARSYQVVLVPSSSFQLLTHPPDAARAMRRFHDSLLPGGTLVMPWIDIPTDYPDGREDVFERERTLPDGSVIRRRYRGWYDPLAGLEHTDDRYELLRHGFVVAQERKVRSPAVRQYDRQAITALHSDAGFVDLRFLSEFTHQPARPDDRIVTTLARRPGSS
jgi:SAM-dependent methyltransferase